MEGNSVLVSSFGTIKIQFLYCNQAKLMILPNRKFRYNKKLRYVVNFGMSIGLKGHTDIEFNTDIFCLLTVRTWLMVFESEKHNACAYPCIGMFVKQ